MRVLRLFLSITFLLASSMNANALDAVRYNISETYPEAKQAYYIDLLKLILDASSETCCSLKPWRLSSYVSSTRFLAS